MGQVQQRSCIYPRVGSTFYSNLRLISLCLKSHTLQHETKKLTRKLANVPLILPRSQDRPPQTRSVQRGIQ